MTRDDWLEIMTRLPVPEIPEFDAAGHLSGIQPMTETAGPAPIATRNSPGLRCAGADAAEIIRLDPAIPPPASRIWPADGGTAARFGVRVRSAPGDIRPLAARLVAAAAERGTYPIILSHIHRSGFEHMGFRVERIHASTRGEEMVQEQELVALWDLVMIVDLEDVGAMS